MQSDQQDIENQISVWLPRKEGWGQSDPLPMGQPKKERTEIPDSKRVVISSIMYGKFLVIFGKC